MCVYQDIHRPAAAATAAAQPLPQRILEKEGAVEIQLIGIATPLKYMRVDGSISMGVKEKI